MTQKNEEYNQKYTQINSSSIDKWCDDGWKWGQPISHETYVDAVNGNWNVMLTPNVFVPHDWFGDLKGKKVLGLASGGGQQMPIFAALGAECTVLDYSEKQLEKEKQLSEQEGYAIRIIRADMTQTLPFEDGEFDLIFHPVSNCYIKEVKPVWKECYRILKKGGVLLAGLDNGINFMVDEDEKTVTTKMPYDPTSDPELMKKSIENDWGIQFSHTMEEQIGGQLEAGLILTNLFEDTNDEGHLRELNIKTFVATRSVK